MDNTLGKGKKPKVIIFGGGGFIGSHLIENLLANLYEVTIFVRRNFDPSNILHAKDSISIIEGDYFNEKDVSSALKGQEILCHLISTTVPQSSIINPIYDIESNVLSTMRLFEKALESNVNKIIFASSGGTVYGVPETIPIKEDHPLNPISFYGLSKITIEKYLYLLHHLHGVNYKVLRLANPYGIRQTMKTGQGVIRIWLDKLVHNQVVEVWGDGKTIRDYIYITDAVEAIRLAMESETEEKILNIGSGVGFSLNEIIDLLEVQTGKKLKVQYKEKRSFDVPVNVLDIELAKKTLKWEPKVGLENGISLTWYWLKHSYDNAANPLSLVS